MPIFHYPAGLVPATPYLLMDLVTLDGAKRLTNRNAQVDTGADRTVVPFHFIQSLGLTKSGERQFAGFGGLIQTLSLFQVVIELPGCSPRVLEIVESPTEPVILAGRDLLNQFLIVLDGPKSRLEITPN